VVCLELASVINAQFSDNNVIKLKSSIQRTLDPLLQEKSIPQGLFIVKRSDHTLRENRRYTCAMNRDFRQEDRKPERALL
jgi:hypothetical protein